MACRRGQDGALVVVEVYPLSDTCLRLRPGFLGMQIGAFILQRPPQPFCEDVIEEAAFASLKMRTFERRKAGSQGTAY